MVRARTSYQGPVQNENGTPYSKTMKNILKGSNIESFFLLQSLNLSCVFQICYLMSLFPSTGMFVGEVQTLTGAGALP